jgi:hypothetical protein
MKLKKFLKLIDPLNKVAIYTQDDEDGSPTYEGEIIDIPWWLMEKAKVVKMKNESEPAYLWYKENEYKNLEGIMIINVKI